MRKLGDLVAGFARSANDRKEFIVQILGDET